MTTIVSHQDAYHHTHSGQARYSGTLCLDRVKPLLSQSLLGAEPSRQVVLCVQNGVTKVVSQEKALCCR